MKKLDFVKDLLDVILIFTYLFGSAIPFIGIAFQGIALYLYLIKKFIEIMK